MNYIIMSIVKCKKNQGYPQFEVLLPERQAGPPANNTHRIFSLHFALLIFSRAHIWVNKMINIRKAVSLLSLFNIDR